MEPERMKIKDLEKKVFCYTNSEADKKYFRQQIQDFVMLKTKYTFLADLMDNAVWERNNKGETSNYMYYNQNNGKLCLDRYFYEWCRRKFEDMKKAVEALKKVAAPATKGERG